MPGERWWRGAAGAALAALCSLAAASAQPTDSLPDGLALGVVRGDGFVHLVGTWHAPAWRALTMRAGDASRLSDEARRLPRVGWRFVSHDDYVPRPLTIEGSATVKSHCLTAEGFASDAPRRPAARTSGVALLGEAVLERAEDVTARPDDDSRRALSMV